MHEICQFWIEIPYLLIQICLMPHARDISMRDALRGERIAACASCTYRALTSLFSIPATGRARAFTLEMLRVQRPRVGSHSEMRRFPRGLFDSPCGFKPPVQTYTSWPGPGAHVSWRVKKVSCARACRTSSRGTRAAVTVRHTGAPSRPATEAGRIAPRAPRSKRIRTRSRISSSVPI